MISRTFLALAVLCLATTGARADGWIDLDPANLLHIETSRGAIVVELRPDLAPNAVERIKMLARDRIYDGLQFHRVIDGFVAQTGNPNNRDGGGTEHPDLVPEFTFAAPPGMTTATRSSDGSTGFVGTLPVQTSGRRAWAAHCDGVVGMGRQEAPGSANSELYFMRGAARRLDHDYTIVGRVVAGLDVVHALPAGEPPAAPAIMRSARIVADLPPAERPKLQRTDEAGLRARIEQVRTQKGADFSICDVEVPVRRTR